MYKKLDLNITFKSSSNLQNILCRKNKPSLPPNSNPGVYKIQCDCGGVYIGETGAKIETRICQHQKSVFSGNWKDSGLSEHAKSCHGQFGWNNVKTLAVEPKYFTRSIRESLEIQKFQANKSANEICLNRDTGKYLETQSWKPLLKRLGN